MIYFMMSKFLGYKEKRHHVQGKKRSISVRIGRRGVKL